VQIAESVDGRRRIVRHVGSARDEAELGLLIEEAHRLLTDDRQGVLDLGITPAVRKATMVGPSAQAGLFPDASAAGSARQLVPRSRVLKTSSRVFSPRWPSAARCRTEPGYPYAESSAPSSHCEQPPSRSTA
jgi:hypothetical protein